MLGGEEGTGSCRCEVIDIIERGSDAGNDERDKKWRITCIFSGLTPCRYQYILKR